MLPELYKEGDYRSFRDMLERLARILPEQPVLSDPGPDGQVRTLTAAALYEEFLLLGEGLLASGLGAAHIAIVSRNCSRYIIALLSILCGDGVAIPIDAQAPAPLLETLLSGGDADAVFCDLPSLPKVLEAQRHCPRVRTIITLEGRSEGALSYDGLLAAGRGHSRFRELEPDPDLLRMILFSSGTTGANKGVMLSQTNLLSNIHNILHADAVTLEKSRMALVPMHHTACICFTLSGIANARHNCFCGDLRDCMSLIRLFRPGRLMVVPMMVDAFYRQICAATRKAGLAKPDPQLARGLFGGELLYVSSGGAALRPELIRNMNEAGIGIINTYGTTECSPTIAINMDTAGDPVSVGPPLPGMEIRLDDMDEDGVGTLCVRGKNVALGYYKDPEATRAVFGADGFFNTGDSVRLDAQGRIVHMGRKANTLVLPNGENIHPQEIEQLIRTELDYVAEAVVYAARLQVGKAARQVLCAGLYVPDEARRADRARIEEDLHRINRGLPAFKRIEYVEVPDTAYPKTASLKLRRTGLPEDCSGTGILLTLK